MASRVVPPDAEEIASPAAPQARVYGRRAQPPADTDEDAAQPPHTDQDTPGEQVQPPAVAPQSPGRVSGRVTVGARVTPTPPAPQVPTYNEFTDDLAGRGRPGTAVEPYTENSPDISTRGPSGNQPYVPAPALSSLHARPPLDNGFPPPPAAPERPRMGGVFPGPPSRSTVAPPGPGETTNWSGPGQGGAEQGRFDQFKPDAEAPATPHVRMLPVLLSVIIGAVLLVGLAIGVVWLISRGSDSAGFTVSAGDCVKRSGDQAIKATCGDAGAFQVVSIADAKEQCTDPGQPYVLNPTKDGKTQVLCLKPSS